MLRRLRMRRALAGVLTLVLGIVTSVSCVAAQDMTPEQKACCAAMDHDCGAAAIDAGCCSGEAAKADSVSAASIQMPISAPVAILVAVLDVGAPLTSLYRSGGPGTGAPVRPPGIPTYLLVSAFRI